MTCFDSSQGFCVLLFLPPSLSVFGSSPCYLFQILLILVRFPDPLGKSVSWGSWPCKIRCGDCSNGSRNGKVFYCFLNFENVFFASTGFKYGGTTRPTTRLTHPSNKALRNYTPTCMGFTVDHCAGVNICPKQSETVYQQIWGILKLPGVLN